MVSATCSFHDMPDGVLKQQIALWLAPFEAKVVAGWLTTPEAEVAYRTVEAWKAGRTLPQEKHLAAMARRWGRPFVEHLFAPLLGLEVDVEARLDRVLADIQHIKGDIEHERKTRGGAAGRAVGRAAAGLGRAVGAGRGMVVGAGESVAGAASSALLTVTRTASVAVICLALSGAPDGGAAVDETRGETA